VSILSEPHFHDEQAAIDRLESLVWPDGPTCPHCGNADAARIYRIKGKTARPGLRTCADCRKQFTAKVGTVFESSHIPVHKWFQAAHLLASSKKGISAHQLHRTLQVTYKTAWFMAHRLREAMRAGPLAVPMGSGGGAVEADETFIGREPGTKMRRAFHHKMKVLSLIDRDTKQARSVVVDDLTAKTLTPILKANIAKEARVMTDDASHYTLVPWTFAEHGVVRHSADEYVSAKDRTIHTNTLEGYFSVFKRGMKGVYQHCSKKHLHRYLAEFDFRYNNRVALGVNDEARADRALKGIVGKRLTYRWPDQEA
jgi:transposase-like protein